MLLVQHSAQEGLLRNPLVAPIIEDTEDHLLPQKVQHYKTPAVVTPTTATKTTTVTKSKKSVRFHPLVGVASFERVSAEEADQAAARPGCRDCLTSR